MIGVERVRPRRTRRDDAGVRNVRTELAKAEERMDGLLG